MWFRAETVGRFAREALAAGGVEVCAVFRRSFYVRAGERYACVGDLSLGRGPLNALVRDFHAPALGESVTVSLEQSAPWQPSAAPLRGRPDLERLRAAAQERVPEEGLGSLVAGVHTPLAIHAQPGLEALDSWLAGNALGAEPARLVGLGPGLTPSGDDYLGGMLVALRACGRASQADSLWRWLQPRLAAGTSTLSAAHLAAAAAGEGHESLHACLELLFGGSEAPWEPALEAIDQVGHCSGWDALAGAVAVARVA